MIKQLGRKTRLLLQACVNETENVNVMDAVKPTFDCKGMAEKMVPVYGKRCAYFGKSEL